MAARQRLLPVTRSSKGNGSEVPAAGKAQVVGRLFPSPFSFNTMMSVAFGSGGCGMKNGGDGYALPHAQAIPSVNIHELAYRWWRVASSW